MNTDNIDELKIKYALLLDENLLLKQEIYELKAKLHPFEKLDSPPKISSPKLRILYQKHKDTIKKFSNLYINPPKTDK